MNTLKLPQLFLFIGIFLFTLVSHPIYTWPIGLAFIVLFMASEKIAIKKPPLIESIFLLLLIIVSVIRFQIFLINDISQIYIEAFEGRTIGFVLCILTWLIVRSIVLEYKIDYLGRLIGFILTIHVGFFFIQLFTFIVSDYYIDFVKPFSGIESRYGGFMGGSGIIRATGMMVEPSTYFFVILTLFILLLLKDGFLRNKKLLVMAIISMYLTLSTAALFIATLLVFYILYSQKIKWHFYVIFIIFLFPLLFLNTTKFSEIYEAQSNKTAGRGGDIRLALIEAVANREMENVLTGFGYYAVDDNISEMTRAESGRRLAGSINDSGLLVYMWALLGFLGIAYFVLLCVGQYKISKKHFILFLILSLTKIKLFAPLFVFYYAYSLTVKNKSSTSRYIENFSTKKPAEYLLKK